MLTMPIEQGMRLLPWGVVLGVTLAAALIDLRSRRIPNRLTGPALLTGMIWAAVAGGASALGAVNPGEPLVAALCRGALAGLGGSLLAVFLVGLPFVLLWLNSGAGAGDAKLMAAVGAWLGVFHGCIALLCVALAGGILSVVYAASRRQLTAVLVNVVYAFYNLLFFFRHPQRISERSPAMPSFQIAQAIPYGSAICFGVCAAAVGVSLWKL